MTTQTTHPHHTELSSAVAALRALLDYLDVPEGIAYDASELRALIGRGDRALARVDYRQGLLTYDEVREADPDFRDPHHEGEAHDGA